MALFDDGIVESASHLLQAMRDRSMKIVTAESCTGGLIAALLTEIAGSSDVVERGYVTYSNAAKTECLGVPADLIAEYGAVSAEVAASMALGALRQSKAQISIAVTGIAGPGGGSVAKPVGLVHVAIAERDGSVTPLMLQLGDIGRGAVRLKTVEAAIAALTRQVEG